MSIPNFLCVGAQKAGTTTLYEVLKQHPDIYLPDVKEPHFFDEHFQKGVDWYKKTFFNQVKDETAIGEITPAYLYMNEAPQRILETLGPEVKLIFIFRNPADRAYSHFLMSKFNGYEKASFDEVMGKDNIGNKTLNTTENRRFSYKERGYYGRQLSKYMEVFPKKNMHFVLFEDLVSKNKQSAYGAILRFLGVKDSELNFNIRSNTAKRVRNSFLQKILLNNPLLSSIAKKLLPNASTRKSIRTKVKHHNQKAYRNDSHKLSPELRELIIKDCYKEDVLLLEKLIEKDLSHWYATKI